MTTIIDTRVLMDDFMQRNEKLKSLIGESLPSKEKKSKIHNSNEMIKSQRSYEKSSFMDDSQHYYAFNDSQKSVKTQYKAIEDLENIDFLKIEKIIEESLQKAETQQFENENPLVQLQKDLNEMHFDNSQIILKSNSIHFQRELSDNSFVQLNTQRQRSNNLQDDLITTQEMSRILDMTFTNSTVVNLQKDGFKPTPKSPIFKNAIKKQGLNCHYQNFLFDLKSVKECNNQLEESKEQDDFSEDSLFSKARKRLNLETALLEKSSVVSDNIDIKSNQSASELVTKVSPQSDKIQQSYCLKGQNIEDIIKNVAKKHEGKLCQQLEQTLDPSSISLINNTFDALILELVKNIQDQQQQQLKPHLDIHFKEEYIYTLNSESNENIQTQKINCDDKSDNSSKYITSVAAFSAQPITQVCNNCKRRISLTNNFVIPKKGSLNINPFCQIGNGMKNIKRVMSGPEFFQSKIITKKSSTTKEKRSNENNIKYERNDSKLHQRKRSFSFDREQRLSKKESMVEDNRNGAMENKLLLSPKPINPTYTQDLLYEDSDQQSNNRVLQ